MRLYDLHYHAFDLSHVNLIAFLSRDDLITAKELNDLMKKVSWYYKIVPLGLAQMHCIEKMIAGKARNFILEDSGRIRSLLSVLENAIESHFLYIDYFLRTKNPVIGNPQVPNAEHSFGVEKIILCPLLMDFGYKNLGTQPQFYNIPPSKPIVNQVVDMINAIYFYNHFEFLADAANPGKLRTSDIRRNPSPKLFEIYPFLGINTANYKPEEIERLFEKYFTGFEHDTPEMRRQKLLEKMGTIHIDITEVSERKGKRILPEKTDFNYVFAGIKVYPPLGFDPWPDDKEERGKVELLYRKCMEKKIPVITHCSDGGFLTDPHGRDYSDPGKHWKSVLTNPGFRDLKIDFAHFGSQTGGSVQWKKSILGYMDSNPNVYTDISCCGMKPGFYESLQTWLTPANTGRFLFGSDFLINMLWIDSYNEYLDLFLSTKNINTKTKVKLCNENSEKFLFGN